MRALLLIVGGIVMVGTGVVNWYTHTPPSFIVPICYGVYVFFDGLTLREAR